MVRLEGYHCPTHGDVFARDRRFGPCPKCEAEERRQKIAAAKARIAGHDAYAALQAEVVELRRRIVDMQRDGEALVTYWNDVAKRLEKGNR